MGRSVADPLTEPPTTRLDRWIPLAEAARLAEVEVWTMRRRLHALNAKCGGRAMRSYERRGKPRKYFVSLEALLHFMRTDPTFIDEEFSEVHGRLQEFERKLTALRDSHRALKRRVDRSSRGFPE